MDERRRLPRKIADHTIEVHDISTDRHLGRVVNLTHEGLMLIGSEPLESHLVFQLELTLDTDELGYRRFGFGAESLWCSSANRPHHFWTGFRIIDISLETIEIIEGLIDAWSVDEDMH